MSFEDTCRFTILLQLFYSRAYPVAWLHYSLTVKHPKLLIYSGSSQPQVLLQLIDCLTFLDSTTIIPSLHFFKLSSNQIASWCRWQVCWHVPKGFSHCMCCCALPVESMQLQISICRRRIWPAAMHIMSSSNVLLLSFLGLLTSV